MLTTRSRAFDSAFLMSATTGTPVGGPAGDRVTTDSRGDVSGALFVALSGERFDGHDFVEAALERGAGGALVSASWWGSRAGAVQAAGAFFVVPDTLLALQDLARAHRARFTLPVAAVTGSNGKTTTKELLAAALSPLGEVLRTQGNLNNHIGVPLTLLGLTAGHRAAVVEMGLNHPGELRLLSRLARPRVAIITNAEAAHLEGLGSLEGVARAKAEIAEGLEPGGVLLLPHGHQGLETALRAYRGRRLTFGMDPGADVHPLRVESRGLEGVTVHLPDGAELRTALLGEHAALNLLAAVAAAQALGVAPAEAAAAVGSVRAARGRLCPRRAGGVVVLDDSYNANPASLAAALGLLRRLPGAGRRWAILGEMRELGPAEAALHREAGSSAAFLDGLVVVGGLGMALAEGAVAAGLDPGRVRAAAAGEEAAAMLLPDLLAGDVVLVKASRAMRLETAVDALLAGLGGEG